MSSLASEPLCAGSFALISAALPLAVRSRGATGGARPPAAFDWPVFNARTASKSRTVTGRSRFCVTRRMTFSSREAFAQRRLSASERRRPVSRSVQKNGRKGWSRPRHPRTRGNTVFLDANLEPHPDQWAYLLGLVFRDN